MVDRMGVVAFSRNRTEGAACGPAAVFDGWFGPVFRCG
jgi:hypothetical protein